MQRSRLWQGRKGSQRAILGRCIPESGHIFCTAASDTMCPGRGDNPAGLVDWDVNQALRGYLPNEESTEPIARMAYQIPPCKRFRSSRNIQSTARNISCLPLLVARNQVVPRRTRAL